jgi:hypothetical protein
MVVVIEAILAEVADIDVRPSVVVVVGDGGADSPTVISNAGLRGHVGEGAIVIVVKERSVGRSRLAGHGVVACAVDEIDVEPSVVVVIDKADARTNCLDDEVFLAGSQLVGPYGQARFLGDVLKDDSAVLDEAARSDGSVLAVEDRRVGSASSRSAHRCLAAFLRLIRL